MHRLRIAIVGLEFGSKVLLPAFRRDARCEVVALCGTNIEKARRVAEASGVREAFGDWRKMLRECDLDAVVSSAPPGPQVEIASAALKSGLHVFAEKPLGVTSRETSQLVALSNECKKTTMVDFEFIEVPAFKKALEVLKTRSQPMSVNVEWSVETFAARDLIVSWKCDIKKGGGALHNFGSHVLHNLEWFLGPVSNISARLSKRTRDPRDTFTAFELDLKFHLGHEARVKVDTASANSFVHRWDFGGLVLENLGTDYMGNFFLRQGSEVLVRPEPIEEDGRIAPSARMASRFISGILSGASVIPGFREGHRVAALTDLALAGQGVMVPVPK